MRTIYFIIAAVAASQLINAGAAERRMTLAECIDSALVGNPQMKVATLSLDKAHTLKGTAFDAPQTSVTLQQETTGGGGPENGVNFSQDFEFPSVYVARHKALKARENLEADNYLITRDNVVRDVTSAYYTVLYLREILRIREAQDSLYTNFSHIASVRYENGECSRLEPMNADRLLNANRVALTSAANDLRAAEMNLMYLLGAESPVSPVDESQTVMIADFDADAFDFASTPRGKAADSEVKVSEKELNVTRHEFLPGITVGATAQALIKGFNPYNVDRSRFEQGNFMGFEVGITVPLFFGAQRSRAKAAKKDVEIARMQRESAEKESKNEYNAALDRLKAASANLAYYTVDGSAQAAEIARIADVSYRLGEIDYVEYISNLETAYEMQSGYADAINEYNQTVILLNYLTGKISDR